MSSSTSTTPGASERLARPVAPRCGLGDGWWSAVRRRERAAAADGRAGAAGGGRGWRQSAAAERRRVLVPPAERRDVPCFAPPYGALVAVNVNTGDIAWSVPLGINE